MMMVLNISASSMTIIINIKAEELTRYQALFVSQHYNESVLPIPIISRPKYEFYND